MLFEMAGAKIELTECLRSDRQLFEAYSRLPALYNTGNIGEIVKAHKEFYPYKTRTANNVMTSHEKRLFLNKKYNIQDAPKGAKLIRVSGRQAQRCAQQTMLLWPGLQLLGCITTPRKGVKNAVLYTIEMIDDGVVKFVELSFSFTYSEVKEFSGSVTHVPYSRVREPSLMAV